MQYFLEITSLKDKHTFRVQDIDLHVHEKNNQCFIITSGKGGSKMEIFESEHTEDIYGNFQDYKRQADENDEKKADNAKKVIKGGSVVVAAAPKK